MPRRRKNLEEDYSESLTSPMITEEYQPQFALNEAEVQPTRLVEEAAPAARLQVVQSGKIFKVVDQTGRVLHENASYDLCLVFVEKSNLHASSHGNKQYMTRNK